jgi:glycosyltransferase involved in cell wall biosynthesis
VPVVARLHGSASFLAEELGRPLRRSAFLLERASLRRAESWSAPSRYVADATRRIFGLRRETEILPNPVEVPPAGRPGTRDTADVVFAGTLNPNKGIAELLKAWPLVRARNPRAHLHVFGRDTAPAPGRSMRRELEESIPREDRASVVFHGLVPREILLAALDSARAAVFPSRAEAFGLAPLEAMSRGCPTVFTRRCSGPEILRDGEEGLLIDPMRPEEIAGAVLRLLSDDELAARLGRAARRRVEQDFSVHVVAARHEEFLRRRVAEFRR